MAVDEFHDDVQLAVILARIEHSDSVAVIERCRCRPFANESFASRRIRLCDQRCVKQFDRNLTPQPFIERGVDPRRTARSELGAENITVCHATSHTASYPNIAPPKPRFPCL